MKPEDEQPSQAWLDTVDAMIAGQDDPAAHEDELLQLARRLTTGLIPLRTINPAAVQRRQRLLDQLHARQARTFRKRRTPVWSAVLVALLLVVLASGAWGAGALEGIWNAVGGVWDAATSLQQVQGVSLVQLEREHPSLHPLPLLPTALPSDTQGVAYGVVTDAHDPSLLRGFIADYRIAGQEVALFEQPSSFPLASSVAQPVSIGNLDGQVFTDTTGNHALQWYQDGLECQLTSNLPVKRLVDLAELFQPVKNWDAVR